MTDDAKTSPPAAPMRSASPTGRPAPPHAFHEGLDRLMQAFAWPRLFDGVPVALDGGPMGLRIDVSETDDALRIEADLPGVDKADVDVTLLDDVLRIRAEKKTRADRADDAFRIVERAHGVFERAIAVPHGVKPEEVTTGFSDGVLTITVPKPAEAAPRAARIPV